MNWYSIGSLSFPASWAAIVVAAITTMLFLHAWKKKIEADVYSNAIFTFIITWKLSIVLFSFQLVLDSPLSILYFNGGMKGYWLGICTALLYFLIRGAKRLPHGKVQPIVSVWMVTVATYELTAGILNEAAIGMLAIQAAVNLILIIFILRTSIWNKFGHQMFILFTCMQALFISLYGNLLSTSLWTYVIVALALYLKLLKRSED